MYVFDTNIFSQLFNYYYRDQFPSLWSRFEEMVQTGRITSTREVRNELEDFGQNPFRSEIQKIRHLFPAPTAAEAQFVSQIFSVTRFREIVPRKQLLKGGRTADPFVIARAKVIGGTVVTNEVRRNDSPKIPYICDKFGIQSASFREFMELENWVF